MDVIHKIEQTISAGDFTGAIKIIESQPQEAQDSNLKLIYSLAVAQRFSKQFDKAVQSNHKLLRIFPDYGRGWQELGHCYLAMGDKEKAASHFYNAIQFNPSLLAAWKFLEEFYEATNNEPALEFARETIDWLTSLPQQLRGAIDLLHEGEIAAADMLCRNFLMMHKHHPEAMLLLADIAMKNNVFYEAEFLLDSCVELHPDHLRAGIAHGTVLNRMGDFQKAYNLCVRLEEKHPNEHPLQLIKGFACYGLGKLAEALCLYDQMIKQKPAMPFLRIMQGHCFKSLGKIDEAIESYHQACKIQPDIGDAWWSLANTKTYQFTHEEIARMAVIVDTDSTTINNKIHIDFALGKAHEHNKDYDLSFKHYERGNQLKQHLLQYDIAGIERMVDAHIEDFTPQLFESLNQVGFDDPAPVFILGLPRAGSTLLEQILASHSLVDGTSELHNILSLVARLKKNNVYPSQLNTLDMEYFKRFGEQYIKDTQTYRGDAAYFIDKMPNNFMHIGLIKLILPNAKVIDARRNPMDCCFSGFKQLFGEGQEFSYSLGSIARYYKAYEKMMAHWQKVLPGFVLHIQHEDVIEDLETQVHRMLDFCQLPFEQNCLEFYNTKRNIKTPSSEQVRQPVNRKGLHQWKPYEQHLGVLKEYFQP